MGLLGGFERRRLLGRNALFLGFLAAIVAILNLSTGFVLERVTDSFDVELGLRLTTVAQSAVTAATPELLLDPEIGGDSFVRETLADIAARHDLENVFVVGADGATRFDLGGDSGGGAPGRRNPFLDLDPAAFARAVEGAPSASRSIAVAGAVLKTAYAPIESWHGGAEAVLGVTAGADFLERVPALRRTLVAVGVGSTALVAALAVLFFGMTRRLARTEAALSHAETLAAMGLLAAGVAHEIRNPLTIIAASAARLKRKLAPGTEAAELQLLDSIPEEVERMNSILEGYLRFARDEPLAFVDCDLAGIVRRSAALLRTPFEESRVALEVVAPDSPVPLRADPQRLQQVILNLLLNAAQAMPGGGAVTLTISASEKRATLAVEDRGPGFTREGLRSAFEPFYTTKEKGSGLGLAMAKRIVEGHGGTITLANREGGGAVARVTLPAEPSAED